MVLSVLRSPSPLRRGALHRLVFFSLMIFQSPMTHSAGGSPISPLQVVAKFFKQQQQQAKSPDQVPVYLTAVCRAMLFPGNLVRSVDWSAVVSFDSLAAFANGLNATGVWEEAFELATKQTGWWKSIKSPEILLAGSWSLLDVDRVVHSLLRGSHRLLHHRLAGHHHRLAGHRLLHHRLARLHHHRLLLHID